MSKPTRSRAATGRTNPGHGPVSPACSAVRSVLLGSIEPNPLNEELYRPVDPNDPAVRALAEDIAKHGLLEPIVLTANRFILSGHRRRVACLLAGLQSVPCRIVDIGVDDPRVPRLLAAFNNQRVKSLDEVVREILVTGADAEESYRLLIEHRACKARVDVEAIPLRGTLRRCRISGAKEPFIEAILRVLGLLRRFWPVSVRQIHYNLLNDPPLIHASKPTSRYRNDKDSYKALDELLTRARIAGRVPFHAIHDPTRPVVTWGCHREPAPFVRQELDGLLKGYYRDLQQSQPNHLEVIGEKNTVESVIRRVAMDYCIPMTIGRGYSSLPPRYEMARRFEKSGKEQLVLIVLADFDPEGEDIGHAFARSMRDDFGVEAIVPVKAGLTAAQVRGLCLPPVMTAKERSSRAARFVEKHGSDVFELEAVPPDRLGDILRRTIDSVLDIGAFNAEVDQEKRDAAHLAGVRRRPAGALRELGELGPPSAEEE
jgi:hypothetical protein